MELQKKSPIKWSKLPLEKFVMQLKRFFIKIYAFGFFLLQVSAKREQNDVIKIGEVVLVV